MKTSRRRFYARYAPWGWLAMRQHLKPGRLVRAISRRAPPTRNGRHVTAETCRPLRQGEARPNDPYPHRMSARCEPQMRSPRGKPTPRGHASGAGRNDPHSRCPGLPGVSAPPTPRVDAWGARRNDPYPRRMSARCEPRRHQGHVRTTRTRIGQSIHTSDRQRGGCPR